MKIDGIRRCSFSFNNVDIVLFTKNFGEVSIALSCADNGDLKELNRDIEERLIKIIKDIQENK